MATPSLAASFATLARSSCSPAVWETLPTAGRADRQYRPRGATEMGGR